MRNIVLIVIGIAIAILILFSCEVEPEHVTAPVDSLTIWHHPDSLGNRSCNACHKGPKATLESPACAHIAPGCASSFPCYPCNDYEWWLRPVGDPMRGKSRIDVLWWRECADTCHPYYPPWHEPGTGYKNPYCGVEALVYYSNHHACEGVDPDEQILLGRCGDRLMGGTHTWSTGQINVAYGDTVWVTIQGYWCDWEQYCTSPYFGPYPFDVDFSVYPPETTQCVWSVRRKGDKKCSTWAYTPGMAPFDPPADCLFCRVHLGYDPPCRIYNNPPNCHNEAWLDSLYEALMPCKGVIDGSVLVPEEYLEESWEE